jgi:glycosyltransferase involved in cell wall biosynthesis
VKRIILAVTNDLYTDQRVHRVAQSLGKSGATVTLIGRLLPYSTPLTARSYKTLRFKLLFKTGFLFYANYNLRLFFYLLFSKADIIVSNDLDTLAACFLAAKLKRAALVYDSHEYFSEVPELVNRKFVRSVWLLIEELFIPRLKYSYTVNESIALIYSQKYNISMEVVRNLPSKSTNNAILSTQLNFPGKKIILYQGSLNVGRGLEMAIDAMKYIETAVLIIIGEGDISQQLRQRAIDLNLDEKVKFSGRIPLDQLFQYTCSADLGLCIEEIIGLNYYYSLPNKLFDYIQARVPIIASDFPEISKIIHEFKIGCTIGDRNPIHFAELINSIFDDPSRYSVWKSNLEKAAEELCWENEEPKLLAIFRKFGIDS